MSYANQSTRYLENDVLSRSPEWLVPLMYEHLLANLNRARVHIETGNVEGRSATLGKAQAILLELLASLDVENGGEVAAHLRSLYSYFAIELINVGHTGNAASLTRLIELVTELHEAWVTAAEAVSPRRGPGIALLEATAA